MRCIVLGEHATKEREKSMTEAIFLGLSWGRGESDPHTKQIKAFLVGPWFLVLFLCE